MLPVLDFDCFEAVLAVEVVAQHNPVIGAIGRTPIRPYIKFEAPLSLYRHPGPSRYADFSARVQSKTWSGRSSHSYTQRTSANVSQGKTGRRESDDHGTRPRVGSARTGRSKTQGDAEAEQRPANSHQPVQCRTNPYRTKHNYHNTAGFYRTPSVRSASRT